MWNLPFSFNFHKFLQLLIIHRSINSFDLECECVCVHFIERLNFHVIIWWRWVLMVLETHKISLKYNKINGNKVLICAQYLSSNWFVLSHSVTHAVSYSRKFFLVIFFRLSINVNFVIVKLVKKIHLWMKWSLNSQSLTESIGCLWKYH